MPGSVSVGGEVYGDRDTHGRVLCESKSYGALNVGKVGLSEP
jgi:hypothetical protein